VQESITVVMRIPMHWSVAAEVVDGE